MHRQSFILGFPVGVIKVGKKLNILTKDGHVTYFVGGDNYYDHPEEDVQSKRFALSSLMENNHVRARDLERELNIPHRTLMNWVKQYREFGCASFYRTIERVKPRVMNPAKNAECAELFAKGFNASEVARQAKVKESTLRKAKQRNAIPLLPKALVEDGAKVEVSTKSERSRIDAEAANGIGTACTRADERMVAAIGLAECATTRFEAGCDVQMAGVLAGLPALCANGLLSGIGRHLKLPKGFYSALHILLTLGFMALCRIRRPEGLRHISPGELGKIIGLDRVPEVRTLREKVSKMARTGNPDAWMKELSKLWMANEPEEAGYLYVDGHIRVYNGTCANLPARFVSREKLCLHGTTDYWVNDAMGRPFFVVSKAITSGLADSLINDIVPELLKTVPGQPTEEELERNPLLHRFVIVFDREGATHSLVSSLWKHRIGALTYRKNVKDVWPETEFIEHDVPIPGGGSSRMMLSKRETTLSSGSHSMPVIEVRRLKPTGHQTAIITSALLLGNVTVAGRMFARWASENFFAYMMQHFDIDGLVEYGAESIPSTVLVVNPKWRNLDKDVKKTRQVEIKLQAGLAKKAMEDGEEIQKNAETVENIQSVQAELVRLRAERKATPKKITIGTLPEAERPTQLLPLNKMFTDSVKMIAYRAETALVEILRRYLKNEDEARALIRELFVTSGDIEPDEAAKTLTIRIHRMANPSHDKAIAGLLEELTKLEFVHPETGAKMIYTLV